MAKLKIQWFFINWEEGYKWNNNLLPQLKEYNICETDLYRAVYVIRVKEKFAINYPKGNSPTLYIGEGNFKNRISSHGKSWLNELIELVGYFPIEIAISIPRARNNRYVYKDVEADLLWEFDDRYGSIPFFNKQKEYSKKYHDYINYDTFIKPLMIGQGKRILWTIKPMPSNKHWSAYCMSCNYN